MLGNLLNQVQNNQILANTKISQNLQSSLEEEKEKSYQLEQHLIQVTKNLEDKNRENEHLCNLLVKSETALKNLDKEYEEFKKVKQEQNMQREDWYFRYQSLDGQIEDIRNQCEEKVRQAGGREQQIGEKMKIMEKEMEKMKETVENSERQVQMITEKYAIHNVDSNGQIDNMKSEYQQLINVHKEVKSERDLLKMENQVLQNMITDIKKKENNHYNNILRENSVLQNQKSDLSPISYNNFETNKENYSSAVNVDSNIPMSTFGNTLKNEVIERALARPKTHNHLFKGTDIQFYASSLPKYEYQATENVSHNYMTTCNDDNRVETEQRAKRVELEQEILDRYLTPKITK